MKPHRAIIVDDEAVARRHLTTLLSNHPIIDLAGEAGSVSQAIRLFAEVRPELIFLDINLGVRTGFDLLNELAYLPKVIFLTAFSDFAVRAFELNAVDYLMKPVFPERLALALGRLNPPAGATAENRSPVPAASPKATGKISSLFLPTDAGQRYVQVDRISLIRANGNYSWVSLVDSKRPVLVYRTLSQWSEILPAHPFIRASRSLIVNADHLESVGFSSVVSAVLRVSGFEEGVVIGRRAIARLRPYIKLIKAKKVR